MQDSLSHRWARFVLANRWWVLATWLVVAVVIRLAAPSWNDVAYDGDFEYLPETMSSVAGGRLLDEAFPGERSRSQIVLVIGRDEDKLKKSDEIVALDLMRRLYHLFGEVCWQRALRYGYEGGPPDESVAGTWMTLAQESFDRAIASDEKFYERISDQVPDTPPNPREPRMAIAYYDRGKLLEVSGAPEEEVGRDFEAALVLMPELPTQVVPVDQRNLKPWETLLDLMSYDDPLIGASLRHPSAQLVVMQLSSELAATGNSDPGAQ